MSTSRRTFLALAAGSVAALGLTACQSGAHAMKKASSPKHLLIFGGTGFIGPALVEVAQRRGHTVTLFNRGKTRPELFPDVEKLRGDRDPDKGEGLKALEGRKFDAVIDDTGYYPRMVGASARLLAPNVQQYVYVSSVSAYADYSIEGQDETGAVGQLSDPNVETMGDQFQNYGPLKAACEKAVQEALPGRATIVRPGYIVGPGDPTDRFTYWPVRADKGGEMMAPGQPSDPLQVIDVRDLAEWLVLVVENNTTGVFNAVGPDRTLTIGETLEACKQASSNPPKLTWVSAEFIEKVEIQIPPPPIWAPPAGEYKGFHRFSNARAIKTGLRFRPIDVTVKDTLAWWKTLPEDRRAKMKAGIPPEVEAQVLEAWHKQGGK